MFLRLSRLRFVLIRSCFLSLSIILFLQIVTLFNHENITNKTDQEVSLEQSSDKDLTDENRLQQIESIDKQFRTKEFNWTSIFLNNYARKLLKINQRDDQTNYKYRFKENQPKIAQTQFDIFEETLVFSRPKFCSSTRIFHSQCPYSNCRWTCEKPSINTENLRRASVFHHVDIKQDEMLEKLTHRSSNDIWILWIDEANRRIENLNQYQFNWTLSFRQDSEISIGTYGILIEKTDKQLSLNIKNDAFKNSHFLQILRNSNIQITDTLLEYRISVNYHFRHKHALWFVSNCGPENRLNYYKQLKTYYPIRAFGSCVKDKCDRNNDCEYNQSNLALFYLAFESQTCTDYITEKFWRALYYGMIPIVLGPSKQSYLDLGIPSSAYIHVDDYKSPKELANHLHKISNDYFLYRNYFLWLNQYEVFYDIKVLEPIRMCELCMRLNMQEYQDHSFYTNVHEWHRNAC